MHHQLKFFLFGMQISAKTVVLHKIFSPKNCTIPRFGPVKRNIIPNDIITVISFLGKMCFKMKWLFFAKMKIPLMSFLSGAAAYYTLLDFESLPVKCTLKKKYWVYSRLNPIRTEWNIKKSFFYKYLDMYYGFFLCIMLHENMIPLYKCYLNFFKSLWTWWPNSSALLDVQ